MHPTKMTDEKFLEWIKARYEPLCDDVVLIRVFNEKARYARLTERELRLQAYLRPRK